jgi:hypothetical protein
MSPARRRRWRRRDAVDSSVAELDTEDALERPMERAVMESRARGQLTVDPTMLRQRSEQSGIEKSRLPVPVVALSAATGLLIVSAAYTAGRLGYASSPWADRAYWLGQAFVVVPVTVRLLGRRLLTAHEAIVLVMVLTIAEYLINICYSPAAFTFTDELLHWRSTVDVLHTGKLFTVNYSLPIGPYYPGLEEATSALVSVTGLSVFIAGLVVTGIAHLVFISLLYMLYEGIGRSYRLAGIAILLYSTSPDVSSFASMFVYETLALTFLALGVFAAWKLSVAQSGRNRIRWFAIAVLAVFAVVVTHHFTSYMLASTLFLVAMTSLLAKSVRSGTWLAVLALVATAAISCWVVFVAPMTISYFKPTLEGVFQGFTTLLNEGQSRGPATSGGPAGDAALAGVAVLLVSVVLPLGWWQVWRHHRRRPWLLAMAIGSVSWYAIVAIRLVTSDGSEVAGRAATFVYIPLSLVVAVAVVWFVNEGFLRRYRPTAIAVVLSGALILFFDGLVNGWPPYWERLPGSYQVAGFERSIDPEGIAAANWALTELGPGNRFATDSGNFQMLSSYGYQNPIRTVAFLFESPTYSPQIEREARAQQLSYVLVDLRLDQSLPASGGYFLVDPNADRYKMPLSMSDLAKFDHWPGVARIYDSGDIIIYALQGGLNAP